MGVLAGGRPCGCVRTARASGTAWPGALVQAGPYDPFVMTLIPVFKQAISKSYFSLLLLLFLVK